MYASGLNSEGRFNYRMLLCHACLSSNRTLTMVGKYIDIYVKICDNVRMNVTPQVSLCCECMTMLKNIWAFKKKVENAQTRLQILDYCVKNQASLPGLTYHSQAETEITTYPLDEDETEVDDELENTYIKQPELMIRIEDVRGHYEVEKPVVDLSVDSRLSCDVIVEVEPLSPADDEEEQSYRCWKRTVMLVYSRICGHRYAHHFLRPVSDEVAPLYSAVIRSPTDLGTIKKQITEGSIRTTPQLERALLLMFSNALMYNSTHHDMFHMALELRAETLRELALLRAAQAAAGEARARRRAAGAPRRAPQTTLKESNARLDGPAARVLRRRLTEAPAASLTEAPAARILRRRRTEAPAARVLRRRRTETPAASLTEAPAARVLRRRRTDTPAASLTEAPAARVLRRRRTDTPAASLTEAPAARVLRRRRTETPAASLTEAPAASLTEAPAARVLRGRRRRTECPRPAPAQWDWTLLDLDELLEPRHFSKKCKAVLL